MMCWKKSFFLLAEWCAGGGGELGLQDINTVTFQNMSMSSYSQSNPIGLKSKR
jgi:hypothetical protein